MTDEMKIVPSGAALGADVWNVKLDELDDAGFAQIYKAWLDSNGVLRFPCQELDDDKFLAFAKRFGELDMAPINALGASPVAPDLAILGWRSGPDPVWSASDWASLGTALAHMHRSSTWPLFYSWTMADARNPTVNKVHIGQDGLGLGSRDYYLGKDPYSDPYLVAYHRYLDTLLELSSSILPQAADPSYRNATAHSVIAFETAIAAAQLPSAVLRNPAVSYNAWTRAQLQNETGPNFFWGAYQNALYSDVRGPGQSVPEPIIVDAPPYYRSLFGIVELTPVPTVMAYLQLMWLANSAPHLSQDFVDAQFELSKVTQGVKAQTERWKTCGMSIRCARLIQNCMVVSHQILRVICI